MKQHKTFDKPQTPPLLTPDEVGRILSVNRRTIYTLIRTRQLAAVNVGHRLRVFKEDLFAYLERSRAKGAREACVMATEQ